MAVVYQSDIARLADDLATSLVREVPGEVKVSEFAGVKRVAVEVAPDAYDALYVLPDSIHIVYRWGGGLSEYDEWQIGEYGVRYTGTMPGKRPVPAWAYWVLKEWGLI